MTPKKARSTIGQDPLDRLERKPRATWEYLEVRRGGNHARSINGQDLPNWKKGPLFWDFVNELGAEGWDLAAVDATDTSWIFKRPR